jgi:RNA polymerase sigma-70 factor (ECF subfamily)
MDRQPSDNELLRAARRDPAAFGIFYDRYAGPLFGWLCRETGDAQVAADLTAEAFAAALAGLGRFRGLHDGSAPAWLFGTARLLLLAHHRHERRETAARRKVGMPVHDYAVTDYEAVERRSDVGAVHDELERSLAALPELQRRAIQLRIVDELEYDRVAAEL